MIRIANWFVFLLLDALRLGSWSLAAAQPNVILVMNDDQGYGELSRHGNPLLETPHLDRLASQSVRLTDFHVAPMRTPTRGHLMTGLDALRNGAMNVSSGRTLLRPGLTTMADLFRAAGYRTGIFGKWHQPLAAGVPEIVVTDGRYQAGRALPIATGEIQIGRHRDRATADKDATHLTFTAELPAGPTELTTRFLDADGNEICGAYYVYVERMTE